MNNPLKDSVNWDDILKASYHCVFLNEMVHVVSRGANREAAMMTTLIALSQSRADVFTRLTELTMRQPAKIASYQLPDGDYTIISVVTQSGCLRLRVQDSSGWITSISLIGPRALEAIDALSISVGGLKNFQIHFIALSYDLLITKE